MSKDCFVYDSRLEWLRNTTCKGCFEAQLRFGGQVNSPHLTAKRSRPRESASVPDWPNTVRMQTHARKRYESAQSKFWRRAFDGDILSAAPSRQRRPGYAVRQCCRQSPAVASAGRNSTSRPAAPPMQTTQSTPGPSHCRPIHGPIPSDLEKGGAKRSHGHCGKR